jgi:hypothetical protein
LNNGAVLISGGYSAVSTKHSGSLPPTVTTPTAALTISLEIHYAAAS